jgi:hypothetical protein
LDSRLELQSKSVTIRPMKIEMLARLALASLVVFLLHACATIAPTGPAAFAGTWTNSIGSVLTMKTDGSFDVDLNKDGKRDAWGKLTVEGTTVTIVGTGGVVPKGCAKTTGVYNFVRSKDTLHFTLVKDACKERVKNLMLDWTKK